MPIRKIRNIIHVLMFCLLNSFLSCTDNVGPVENRIDPLMKYSLIWSDEFDGTELDTLKWSYRLTGPRRKAINTEDAISLDGDGNLVIKTYKEGENIYTGMIGTEDKFESKYGYWECRMKMQSQTGQWSAFWLQSPLYGEIIGDTGYSGTEIDIMEYLIKFKNLIEHALHWDGYDEHHNVERYVLGVNGLNEGFHTFGLEWNDNEYIFFVDRIETWRKSVAISHTNQYIVLSIEVDDWAGNINDAKLPDSIVVDYVRVYK